MLTLARISRLLVVEDEAVILLDIEQTLADAGVGQVLAAPNLEEAKTILATTPVDAAILDLHIAGRSSCELAAQLRKNDVPFVFSSGTRDVPEGFADVPLVLKPFSSEGLIEALCNIIAGRGMVAAQ